MFKWLLGLFLAAILCILAFCAWGYVELKASQTPDAQFGIQQYYVDEKTGHPIPTRIYFANDIEKLDNGNLFLKEYWSYDGKKYHRQSDKELMPPYDIIRRRDV